MGCKNPGDSLRKGEGWRRKENVNEQQQNEVHQQMKIQQQNEDTTSKMKWRQQNEDQKWNEDTKKTSLEVLPSKVTLLGVFDFLKKWLQKLY